MLWHYTTNSAFFQIARRGLLRYSEARFSNDPGEADFPWELFLRHEYFGDIRWTRNGRPIPRYISFSEADDQLEQWIKYADDGRGVALGFEQAPMQGFEDRFLPVVSVGGKACIRLHCLGRVRYEKEEQDQLIAKWQRD